MRNRSPHNKLVIELIVKQLPDTSTNPNKLSDQVIIPIINAPISIDVLEE